MFQRLRSIANVLIRRRRFEETMADELRFHMEAFADDLIRSGMPRDEAQRRARLEFGAVETVKEQCRQARRLRLLDELRQDLRYATRMMSKAPLLTTAAVVSLSLGIGANTAIFGFIDAVFLRTLPVEKPQELFYFAHHSGPETSSNYPLYERYRTLDAAFSGVTAYRGRTFRIESSEGVEPVVGQFVSGNYHAVVGARIVLGRGFSNEPDRDTSRAAIGVISDAYWARRFARSPAAIGSTLNVNGRTVEIVGVTAPGFHGLDSESRRDLTLPFSVMALDEPDFFDDHGGWIALRLVGRLRAGVTDAQALATADGAFQQFMREPEQQWVRGDGTTDRFRSATLLSAARGSDGRRERSTTPIRVLLTMAGIVLVIACANVANLLLARAAGRTNEIAIRVSIGAGRLRLVRQMLTEGLLLAASAAVFGLVVAVWISAALLAMFDGGPTPLQLDVGLNARVFAFAFALAALMGIGFSLAPAIRATRVDAVPALKRTGGAAARRRPTPGRLLVGSQIALCVLLLAAAGLLGRSVRNLDTLDAGFDRDRLLLFNVDTRGTEFAADARLSLYADLVERLHGLPGILSVSASTRSPIDSSSQFRRIVVPGFSENRRGAPVSTNVVTPDYFDAFGIRIVRGRGLSNRDQADTPKVAVVGEALARFYFGNRDPVGQTFTLGGEKEPTIIVGIAEDVRHERLTEDPAPKMIYAALAQSASVATLEGVGAVPPGVTIALRTDGRPDRFSAAVRAEVQRLNPNAMVWYIRTMTEQLGAATVRERLLAFLSAGFGGFALLLACVGLYGTMSYTVARRSREIGIRMALGAARSAVLRQVLREGMNVAVVGVVVGGVSAFWATRVLASFLFGLTPRDPLTLMTVASVLLLTALAAAYLPARRAADVQPARVLRAE